MVTPTNSKKQLDALKFVSDPNSVAAINDNTDERDAVNDRCIWASDSETDPFLYLRVPEPFIWGAYNIDTGDYVEFDDTKSFVEWASASKRIVYAHNGGKFDWHFIAPYIPHFSRIKVISGRLAKFKIGEAEFRDSFNILPLPLSAYKKVEFDYRKLERDVRHKHMPEIRHYLRKDCEYLADLLRAFIDQHGTKLTLAGAAMSYWEKMVGEKADQTNESFYNQFSPFYAGGRVQCFKTGAIKKKFKCFDIRSAYPEAMLHKHPYGSVVNVWDDIGDNDGQVGRSFIRLECESHGQFHYRAEDGSLSFPDDGARRVFYTTGWEYIAARDTGTLVAATIQAVYELAGTVSFGPYVQHWFAEKNGSTKGTPRNIIAKFFLNSLYGKFGADPSRYRDYEVISLDYLYNALEDGWNLENLEGDSAFVSQPTPEHARRYYNVATAASITGYVRAKLWKAIKGAKGVIYCDTDCIVAEQPGAIDIDPVRLGAWDIEAECSGGYVAGRKLYAFKLTKPDKNGKLWKTAAKGVKLMPEEIAEVALGNEHIISLNDAPTFRVNGNTLYEGEMIGYVKRDDPQKMFQRRKVRMVRH